MNKNSAWLAVASLFYLTTAPTHAQSGPATNFFQITSGRYTECCGIAGPLTHNLPDANQAFVILAIDPAQLSARMTILRDDMQTVFQTLDNGRVQADRIEFGAPGPSPEPGGPRLFHYIVTNTAAGLRFNGALVEPQMGADIPNAFTHTNIVAIPLSPASTIRVSEVEVCWPSILNQDYQLQYRSALTSNTWINLGIPVTGNGSNDCVADKVPPGEPRRFYRVVNSP